jgi:hypothetical protein
LFYIPVSAWYYHLFCGYMDLSILLALYISSLSTVTSFKYQKKSSIIEIIYLSSVIYPSFFGFTRHGFWSVLSLRKYFFLFFIYNCLAIYSTHYYFFKAHLTFYSTFLYFSKLLISFYSSIVSTFYMFCHLATIFPRILTYFESQQISLRVLTFRKYSQKIVSLSIFNPLLTVA